MTPLRSMVQQLLSPKTAVLHAKQLAIEYRDLLRVDPESYFPPPRENEVQAYEALLDLALIAPDSYQWTAFGMIVLNLRDADLAAVFTRHLDVVLFPVDERPTIPIRAPLHSLNAAPRQIANEPEFESDRYFQDIFSDQLLG